MDRKFVRRKFIKSENYLTDYCRINKMTALLFSIIVIKFNFYPSESVPTTAFPQLTNENTTFNNNEESFSTKYQLNDGEIVTKFKWKDILAIETAFEKIDLVQLIKNDRQIIQFWLSNGKLVDCEYTNDPNTINQFHKEFHKINPNIHKDARQYKTLIEEHTNLTVLPKHLQRLTEYEKYKQECSQLHKKVKHYFKTKTLTRNPGQNRKSRMKRDALVFPGTKWCGKGSNGKEFEDLGDYSFADRCCRDHDRCKYSIGPFERQYYLFNYRFHYVSHCSCDERFRSCLKVANSGAANLVGKIYFNVVKTKCFMFKMDDMCIEHSWWGSCLETKRRKRAVFRDPMTY